LRAQSVQRQRGRISNPGRGKNFFFSTTCVPVLGPTKSSLERVPRALSEGVGLPDVKITRKTKTKIHNLSPLVGEVITNFCG
jgi:hypothetical protein